MKKTVIQLLATTIFQLEAGEHEAIVTPEGTFLKVIAQEAPAGGATETVVKEETAKPEPTPPTPTGRGRGTAPAPVVEEAEEVAEYTEEQLSKMNVKQLGDLLAEKGIDHTDWNGQGTNKKLRTLYLTGSWEAGLKSDGEVADDTPAPAPKASAPAGRGRGTAPAKSNEPKLIEDWGSLENGTPVLVKLNYPDDPEASAVFHEATTNGWDVPEGETESCMYVIFDSDGQEDYLRDGDEVYEFKVKM